jgi:pre-60S factor REI1
MGIISINCRTYCFCFVYSHSIGWTSLQTEAAAKKARDIHAMKRQQSKLYQKIGVKANKFQKHYRAQVLF